MLEKLHITAKQWLTILKWTLYLSLFVFVVLVQTVLLGNVRVFGVHLNFLPVLLTCICIWEEPASGSLFALLASLLWCLSGADFGSLAILVWPVCGFFSAVFCRLVIRQGFLSCLLCGAVNALIYELMLFVCKHLLRHVSSTLLLTKALPCALLSLLAFIPLYYLVKCISRIGGRYGS